MAERDKFSRTIRIDLIPDAPVEPVEGREAAFVSEPEGTSYREMLAEEFPIDGSDYQELLQRLYDAALITDLDGNVIDVNVRAVEFLRYHRERLCEMLVFDIICGADASLIETLIENLEDERFTLIQAYCTREDGTHFPSEIAVSKLELDGLYLCFFIRDITLRRQAEEMLRTEHNAIQNAGNGIAVADVGARLEYINPAAATMWGCGSQEEMLGANVRDLLMDTEATEEMLQVVLQESQTWIAEMAAIRRDGTQFVVQVSAACNRNSEGQVIGVIFSFVDISYRLRAEEAEREAERHRVMLESLGAACHHLGQPATVLLANLGVMREKVDTSDPTVRELVDMSTQAAEALGETLHRLNEVNEYKTMQYLARADGNGSAESRILDIE